MCLDRIKKVLGHLVASYADEAGVKFETLIRLEGDVDLFLGLSIHDACMTVELKALIKDLVDLST